MYSGKSYLAVTIPLPGIFCLVFPIHGLTPQIKPSLRKIGEVIHLVAFYRSGGSIANN